MSTVCTNCGAALPLVFGRPADRCDYCRAPQPRPPPAPVPAPPLYAITPVVAPRKQSGAGCLVGVFALLFVLVGAGVAFWVLFATRSAANVSATERARDNAPTPPPPTVAPIPSEPPKPKVDYFASPESASTAIAERFTQNAELRELVLYPEYAVFELRDAAQRNHIDRYVLRSEGIGEPSPVKLFDRDKDRIDKVTFRLSEVRLALVPGLISDAKTRIRVQDGKVSHVTVDKNFEALGFRVYITSQRDSGGYVSYDASGKMRRVVD